jgi:hypothetical protein
MMRRLSVSVVFEMFSTARTAPDVDRRNRRRSAMMIFRFMGRASSYHVPTAWRLVETIFTLFVCKVNIILFVVLPIARGRSRPGQMRADGL